MLDYDVHGGIGVVTLNRPERLNALSHEMVRALDAFLDARMHDHATRVLIVTGAGRGFCAGLDLKARVEQGPWRQGLGPVQDVYDFQESIAELVLKMRRIPQPLIAAVNGPAAGGGFSLALACDLRIAAESAFVTTAYAKLGLSGDYGGSWFLTKLVGPSRAREILFLGERISARECERLGLVDRVVPDAALEREALALGARLAAGAPIALRHMKENLNRALEADLEACLEAEAVRMVESATTEDYEEAVRALAEKRAPVFRGR